MRVAILNLTAGGMSGGYKKYLCNVIPRMAASEEMEGILCVAPVSLDIRGWIGDIAKVEYKSCRPLGTTIRCMDRDMYDSLERFSPNVIFIPVERFFSFKNVPGVNMIQNMEPFIGVNYANPLSARIKNILRVYSARKAIKKADRVIAVSNFVKEFLVNREDVPKG